MKRKHYFLFMLAIIVIINTSLDRKNAISFKLPVYFPKLPESMVTVSREGAQLGRFLFYDPILSSDSSLSCASCHRQEAAFSDGPNQFTTGANGIRQARNTPPIFNLAWHPSFFWDGRAATITEQIFHPVRQQDEMNLRWTIAAQRLAQKPFYRNLFKQIYHSKTIDSNLIANAIAQFELTILSYRSKYDRVLQGDDSFTTDEAMGYVLVNDMTKGDCLHCHTTDSDPLGSTFNFSNNGLDPVMNAADYHDKGRGTITKHNNDNGKFKIPSLRNVAITAPYMHDGRFATLEEVLDFYSEKVNDCANVDPKMEFAYQHGAHLSKTEQKQIIAFLKTLTDSALITDKMYSNPFLQ